jgi:hypothetical protein
VHEPPTHLFVFKDAHAARRFVVRLVDVHKMIELAICVQEERVILIDGGDSPRAYEIGRLAHESDAMLHMAPK